MRVIVSLEAGVPRTSLRYWATRDRASCVAHSVYGNACVQLQYDDARKLQGRHVCRWIMWI